MAKLKVELDENPSVENFRIVVDGVRDFNRDQAGHDRPRSVACFLRDADRIVGGVQGTLWGRSMHIDALWVNQLYRGGGYGSKLMREIEEYAAAHDHPLVYLETTSFQALPFYRKLGYLVFGELAEISRGHKLFFLSKELNA